MQQSSSLDSIGKGVQSTGARSGPYAAVLAISSPKESVCILTECRNEIKVGEETTFSAYIQNAGFADITEMGYTVTVYLSDDSGNPSLIAKDASGNDLQWSNEQVICANANFCAFTSLAAGATLDNGKHNMQTGRTAAGNVSDFTWIPDRGQYVVQFLIDSPDDVDVGNDAQEVYVSVVDWYDIELDLAWDSGDDLELGSGSKDWTLTMTTSGSNGFTPFDVNLRLQTFGEVSTAYDSNGNSIDHTELNVYAIGTSQRVDVYTDMSTSPPTTIQEYRRVSPQIWTLQGTLVVDSSLSENSSFGMTAVLVDYSHYKQWGDCVNPNGNGSISISNDYCEKTLTQSDNLETDQSIIEGFSNVFNDIRISKISVVDGYNADGSGQGTHFLDEYTDDELTVGVSYLHVEVEYRGNELNSAYGWNVTTSMTTPFGTLTTTNGQNTCDAVLPQYPTYGPIGSYSSATVFAYACSMVSLDMDGEHIFSAEVVNDSSMFDAKSSNNIRSLSLNVRNNEPIIRSLALLNDGDLYLGQDDLLSMSVQVFDLDDPSGANLEVDWRYQGMSLPGCERANMQITCSIIILPDYVTNFPVSVTVYDAHGGETSEELMLQIWNHAANDVTTASGITLVYNMLYWGTTPFSLNAVEGSDYVGITLPEYSGTYDSVGVIDYTPSTTFSAVDVLSQSMSVSFDKSLGATSLWYVDNINNIWTMISDNPLDTNDATISEFAYTFLPNSPVLSAGQLVLVRGDMSIIDIPNAHIANFYANTGASGIIKLNWNVFGTMNAYDYINITICEGQAGCDSPFTVFLGAGNLSYIYPNSNTIDGVTYNIQIAVCNQAGCSSPIGTGDVIADFDDRVPNTTVEIDSITQYKSWITLGLETTGMINSSDYVSIKFCKLSFNCLEPLSIGEVVGTSPFYGAAFDELEHGEELFISARFCNVDNCSISSTTSVIMDRLFSGEVYAINPRAFYDIPVNVSSEAAESNWGRDRSELMYFEWEVEGDTTELAGWKLCLTENELTEIDQHVIADGTEDYAVSCLTSGDSNTTVFWPKQLDVNESVKLFFNIMPMDEHSNGLQATSIGQLIIHYPFAFACLPQNVNNFSAVISQFGTESNYTIDLTEEVIETPDGTSVTRGSVKYPKCNVNLFDYLSENLTPYELYNLSLVEWQDVSGINYTRNLSTHISVNTTWGLLQMNYGPNDNDLIFDPYANVVSLTAFESTWNKEGPVELSIVLSNPSKFTLSPVVECFNENGTITTSYSIPNETIAPGQEIRFYIYITLEEIRIHNIECRLIPPNELRFMFDDSTANQNGYVNVSYQYDGNDEIDNSMLGSEASIISIIGISMGCILFVVVVFIGVAKFRNRERDSDDEDYDNDDEYGAFVQSFQTPERDSRNVQAFHSKSNQRIPPFDYEGEVNEDGWEICEYPQGSQIWWWKDYDSQSWVIWE